MTRLPSLTPANVVKALKRAGFVVMPGRGRGSHRVLTHPDGREVVIAMHAREMKRGTLKKRFLCRYHSFIGTP